MSSLVQEKDFSPPGVSSYTASGMASAFTVGNTVVVNFGGSQGAHISTISGGGVTTWAQATVSVGYGTGPTYTEIWYGVVGSAGSSSISVTFNKATTTFDPLVVSEWSGALTVDVAGSAGNAASTNPTTPSVTPSVTADVAVAICRLKTAGISNTPSAGWTALGTQAGHSGNASAYKASADTSAQQCAWGSTSDSWSASIATFKAASTQYTKTLTASMTVSGVVARGVSRKVTATHTTSVTAAKATDRTISVAQTFTAAVTRGASTLLKTVTAIQTFTPVLARQARKAQTATMTLTGALARRAQVTRAASQPFTAQITNRAVDKTIATTQTLTPTLVRAARRSIAVTQSFTATVASSIVYRLTLTASQTYSATVATMTFAAQKARQFVTARRVGAIQPDDLKNTGDLPQ